MSLYFTMADLSEGNRFPIPPAAAGGPSNSNTPGPSSPFVSRPPSPKRGETGLTTHPEKEEEGVTGDTEELESPIVEGSTPDGTRTPTSARGRKPIISLSRKTSLERIQTGGSQTIASSVHHRHHHHHHHQHAQLQHNLLHMSLGRMKEYAPVGVFESQRYLNLEAKRLHDPRAEMHTQQMTRLLEEW